MKYFGFISVVLLAAGCVKKNEVSFTGTAPGVNNGVFIVKTSYDSTVYGENIKNEKFKVGKRLLKYQGYYNINISSSDSSKTAAPFEVYLEGGNYAIETVKGYLYKYPKITSSSKIQAELSAYYTLADKIYDEKLEYSKKVTAELKSKGNGLSTAAYNALNSRVIGADVQLNNIPFIALSQFVKEHPESQVSAHLMAKQSYDIDPVAYYNLYKTLSNAEKNTDDGKELGQKLSKLVKLVVGAKAPIIYGKTPDGHPFDPGTFKSKLILIDFWRAGNELSRRNHQDIINVLQGMKGSKKFDVISVSIDSKVDWWVNAINEDHMTWTQFSDLKGDDSENAANWAITQIPAYYLVNDKWEIVERNASINRLDFEVNDYLSHHH